MKIKFVVLTSLIGLLVACNSNSKNEVTSYAISGKACNGCKENKATLINYGEDNAPWIQKLRKLNKGENIKFRIVQIGDSHTAGDYFSHQVRTRLQAKLGNGGIGWIYPGKVNGQRTAQVSYQTGWIISTSRRNNADFPLGGVLATANGKTTQISPINDAPSNQNITFTIRSNNSKNAFTATDYRGQDFNVQPKEAKNWTHLEWKGGLPFSINAQNGDQWELGHINIENNHRGIVYSAMGINGSQFSHWDRWRIDWKNDLTATQADLIVLAYGTNEAFNDTLDIFETKTKWFNTIKQIHSALPNAGILVIGAPESLRKTTDICGERPPQLYAVQKMQQLVAQQSHSLYWSWQDAMGGECSMNIWIAQGLGNKDGVHFTTKGYQAAGDQLANVLLKLAQ